MGRSSIVSLHGTLAFLAESPAGRSKASLILVESTATNATAQNPTLHRWTLRRAESILVNAFSEQPGRRLGFALSIILLLTACRCLMPTPRGRRLYSGRSVAGCGWDVAPCCGRHLCR